MRKIVIIVVIGILTGLQVAGQERELTLFEAIELATDSSLQSFAYKNIYLSSYWEFRSFKAARLPSLSLGMTPIRYNRDITSRYDSEQNIDVYRRQQSLYSYGNLTVKQNLDITGGTFYVDTELGYLKSFGGSGNTQFSSVPIRIGYSQNLFGFNGFKWEKKIEPIKYEKAKKNLLYNMEVIAENTTSYFFTLALAQAQYELAKNNQVSSDTLYRIGMERQKIASISQADLLTLKLDAVNARNTLKNAEISLKRAMFNLASFLNLEKDTKISVALPKYKRDLNIDVLWALECAKNHNPTMLSNRQLVLEAERELERTEKNARFSASLSASIGFNQVSSDFSGAYKNPLQQDVVAIGLTIPLLDWGVNKGKVNMARNNLEVTQIEVQQKELSIEQDILMTINDFAIQQDLIASAEEAVQLAETAYEITKQRFVIGKADINSLTLSQNRRESAQKNYITALNNYWQGYYKIRKMTLYDFERKQVLDIPYERIHGK